MVKGHDCLILSFGAGSDFHFMRGPTARAIDASFAAADDLEDG
jgi:hypothetical protein